MSFSASERLKERADFDQLFKCGQKTVSRHFVVLYRFNNVEHGRLGVVASKKNFKHAVMRNRVKRIVRESFRQIKATLPALDIVVIGRQALKTVSNASAIQELNQVWDTLQCVKS